MGEIQISEIEIGEIKRFPLNANQVFECEPGR
jgi:hypothetical protein